MSTFDEWYDAQEFPVSESRRRTAESVAYQGSAEGRAERVARFERRDGAAIEELPVYVVDELATVGDELWEEMASGSSALWRWITVADVLHTGTLDASPHLRAAFVTEIHADASWTRPAPASWPEDGE